MSEVEGRKPKNNIVIKLTYSDGTKNIGVLDKSGFDQIKKDQDLYLVTSASGGTEFSTSITEASGTDSTILTGVALSTQTDDISNTSISVGRSNVVIKCVENFFTGSITECSKITHKIELDNRTALITIEKSNHLNNGWSVWELHGVSNDSYYKMGIHDKVIEDGGRLKRSDLNTLTLFFAYRILIDGYGMKLCLNKFIEDKEINKSILTFKNN